jgi:hypothetical protein
MEPKFNRKTRFPGNDQTLLATIRAGEKNVSTNRRTRFPGGNETQIFHLLEKEKQRIEEFPKKEQPVKRLSRLPVKVNPPNAVSERSTPTTSIKTSQLDQLPPVQVATPWNTYISLRHLERGGQVTVAHTREVPTRMVVVKELHSDSFMELRKRQHENLLAIIEVYRFQGAFFVITDYTAATLKQVIAIPLPLQELHVSATCRQVHTLYMFSDLLR